MTEKSSRSDTIENIVIICSIINCSPGSIFTPEERYQQTLNTIRTVKQKISNVHIILAEISHLTQEQIKGFTNEGVSYIFDYYDQFVEKGHISNHKSLGELFLIISSIEFIQYKLDCLEYPNLKRIFKIGGRNWLSDNFNIDDHMTNKINCRLNPENNNEDIFMTLFSCGKNLLQDLKNIFMMMYKNNCYGTYVENSWCKIMKHFRSEDINFLPILNCHSIFGMSGKEILT